MPKKGKWAALLDTAKTLGDVYFDMLEDVKKERVDEIKKMVETRYTTKLSDVELIIGIYRYESSMLDQDFSPLDREKLLNLYFMLYRLQDQSNISVSNLTEQMIGLTDEGSKHLEDLEKTKSEWLKSKIDLAPVRKELKELREAYARRDYESIKAGWQTIIKGVTGAVDTVEKEWPSLKESAIEAIKLAIEHVGIMYQDGGLVDKDVHTQLKSRMDSLSKSISQVEEELGLRQKKGDASPGAYMRRTLRKVEQYRKLHPTEFTYKCPDPKCAWEGVLERKLPDDGKVINAIKLHWAWKCPLCKEMVAYDQNHPLYTGKYLFSELMWSDVAAKKLKLESMARYMETSLENIIWTAGQLKLEIPPHVRKELKKYEENYRSHTNNGS